MFTKYNFYNPNRQFRILLLSCIWVTGLFAGFYYALHASTFLSSLMRSVAKSRLSIVGLLFTLSLPFFTSAFFLRLSKPMLILAVAFIKAFCFSCCSYSLTVAFGDAGWLVRSLLLFSSSCSTVILLWFWVRNLSCENEAIKADFLLCMIANVLIGCIDYIVVSPFVGILLDH